MQRFIDSIRQIEKNILADPTFKTLTMHSTTLPYLSIRAQEIIKQKIITTQQQLINELKLRIKDNNNNFKILDVQQKNKNIEKQYLEVKTQLQNISQQYQQSLKKNTEYFNIISQLKQEIKIYKRIQQKASQQYTVINEKQEQIIDANIKMQKIMLQNQAMRRSKELVESELEIMKQQIKALQSGESNKKQLEIQYKENKEKLSKLKIQNKQKNDRLYALEVRLIELQAHNQELLTDIKELVDDNDNLRATLQQSSSRRIPQIKKQNIQTEKKLSISQKQSRYDTINLAESNIIFSKKKKIIFPKLLALQKSVLQIKVQLSNLKQSQTQKLADIIQMTANKFLSLNVISQHIQSRFQNHLHSLKHLYKQQLSFMKIRSTQKLIGNKKQMKFYVGQIQDKQNGYKQVQKQLETQRQLIIKDKVQGSKKLISLLETKLSLKDQIHSVKKDNKILQITSSYKKKQCQDISRRQTTKKKAYY